MKSALITAVLVACSFGVREIPAPAVVQPPVTPALLRAAVRQDTWHLCTQNGNMTGANVGYVDLFNALGSGKTITMERIRAVNSGVSSGGRGSVAIFRTTTVGSGGTVVTPVKAVSSQLALPVQVTCRSNPTGGATVSGSAMAQAQLWDVFASNTTIPSTTTVVLYELNPDSEMTPITLVAGEGIVIKPSETYANNRAGIEVIFTTF